MDFQDRDGKVLGFQPVSEGDPTKASDYRQHNTNDSFLKNVKAVVLPALGDSDGDPSPVSDPAHESGGEFWAWRTMESDSNTTHTIVDVSEYGGALSDGFAGGAAPGFQQRLIIISLWAHYELEHVHAYVPGGDEDDFICGTSLFGTQHFFAGHQAGGDTLRVTAGDGRFDFSVDGSTGDLRCLYTHAQEERCAVIMHIQWSPRWPTS